MFVVFIIFKIVQLFKTVRGTTSKEICEMAREAGAKRIYFASAAPPVRYSNVYGIDIPTRSELIAHNRSEEEIAREIGADKVIYNDLEDIAQAIQSLNPTVLKVTTASTLLLLLLN